MRADERAALAEALREVQHAVAVVGHELVQQLHKTHLSAHVLDLHTGRGSGSGSDSGMAFVGEHGYSSTLLYCTLCTPVRVRYIIYYIHSAHKH